MMTVKSGTKLSSRGKRELFKRETKETELTQREPSLARVHVEGWGCGSVVEFLPSICKAWVQSPAQLTHK